MDDQGVKAKRQIHQRALGISGDLFLGGDEGLPVRKDSFSCARMQEPTDISYSE